MPRFQGVPVEEQGAAGPRFGGEPVPIPPALAMSRSNPLVNAINKGVNVTGTGLWRGVAGLGALPGEALDFLGQGFEMQGRALQGENVAASKPYDQDYSFGLPKYAQTKDMIFGTLDIPEVEAESVPGKLYQGALSAVLPGMGGKTAAISAAGGAGAEALSRIFPDNPYATAAGALLGAGTAHGISKFRKPTSGVVRDATAGMTPQEIESAIAMQQKARAAGVPLTPGQASGNPELLTLERMTEMSSAGKPLRDLAQGRPQQMESAVRGITQGVGDTSRPGMNVIKARQAAAGAVKDVEGARTAAAKPFYEVAQTQGFPASFVKPVFKAIDDEIAKVGRSSDIGRLLLDYRKRIDDAIEGRRANVGPLDTIYKETRDKANPKVVPTTSTRSIDKELAAVLGPVNKVLGDVLVAQNRSIAAGRQAYKAASPAVDDILVSKTGELADAKTYTQQKRVIMDPETVREADINRLAREMTSKDKGAFKNWAATYIENEMNAALKSGRGGQAPYVGAKFADIVRNPQSRRNMQAMFNNLPNGSQRLKAFENLIEVLDATAKRMPFGSPTQSATEAGKRLRRAPVPFTERGVMNWLSETIEQGRYGGNMEELARIFTSDDGMALIKELARINPSSDRARLLTGTLLGASSGLRNN